MIYFSGNFSQKNRTSSNKLPEAAHEEISLTGKPMTQASNIQNRDFLPHKRVLVVGAICLAVIGILLTNKISLKKAHDIEIASIQAVAGQNAEEREANQKLLEALQQAKLQTLGVLASSTNPFDPSPKDNVSDRFSKDIFNTYLDYDINGAEFNEDDLINSFSYLDISDINKNKYSLAFLNIFSPTSAAEIKAYGNAFAKVIVDASAPLRANPVKYESDVNEMIPIYKRIGEGLMQLRVPSPVAAAHLQLANDYLKQTDAFVLIGGQVKDPVKALLGLQVVREAVIRQVDIYTQINQYIIDNGIIYDSNEPGSFWRTGTTTISLN